MRSSSRSGLFLYNTLRIRPFTFMHTRGVSMQHHRKKHLVAVIGAGGLIGPAITLDLARFPDILVLAVDCSAENLRKLHGKKASIICRHRDATDPDLVASIAAEADLAITALPGSCALDVLRVFARNSVDVIDVSFFDETDTKKLRELDDLARAHDARCFIDCGVAPGMSNIILGNAVSTYQYVHSFTCAVGGLPVERIKPWEYKAPFAPDSVIDEYLRPARFRRDGRNMSAPPLAELEHMTFSGIGTLEAFNTDGLRTLLRSYPPARVWNMVEKTLRYPGHASKIMELKRRGKFDKNRIARTSEELKNQWELTEEDDEFTVMRIKLDVFRELPVVLPANPRIQNLPRQRIVWEMMDRRDPEDRMSSMARTTGFTASGIARYYLDNNLRKYPGGVYAPERLGENQAFFRHIMEYMRQRGIVYKRIIRHETGDA